MTEMKYRREDGTFGDIILSPSNGGTGQTALVGNPSLLHTLFEGNETTFNHIPCFDTNWASGGYYSRQQLRDAMGLGNTLGAVPVANGGTGATTAANARTNLGAAAASHNHAASAINSGTLALARGGTGASLSAAPSMLTNLGSTTAASIFAARPRPGITGTLPLSHGGTGATSAAGAIVNLGISMARGSSTQNNNNAYYFRDHGIAICGGACSNISVNGGTYGSATLNFPVTFSGQVPCVAIGAWSTSEASTMGWTTITISNVSYTNFTVRYFNGDTQARDFSLYYIAIGPVAYTL